jgi:hypothetical protein
MEMLGVRRNGPVVAATMTTKQCEGFFLQLQALLLPNCYRTFVVHVHGSVFEEQYWTGPGGGRW